jgi:hypothetical protein
MLEFLAICAVLGCIPGAIAMAKGRTFWGFWLYGALLFPVALIHSLVMASRPAGQEARALATGEFRKCPHCAELVKREARLCKHCHQPLSPQDPSNGAIETPHTVESDNLSTQQAAHAIGVTHNTLLTYIKAGRLHPDPDGPITTTELLRAGFIIRH